MWFHDNRHCVTAQYLIVVDHHGCSLDGQGITTWAMTHHQEHWWGATPRLWWLCRLIVGHNWAAGLLPLPGEGFCLLLTGCITSQRRSSHASQQRLGRYCSNTRSGITKTPSGFLCALLQLVQHWSTYFSIWQQSIPRWKQATAKCLSRLMLLVKACGENSQAMRRCEMSQRVSQEMSREWFVS